MTKSRLKIIFILHIILMLYSIGGIFSKKAASVPFMSFQFCFYYGIVFLLLIFYAIGWQQIIKKLPLTTAFANKAVTIVWGIVWGNVFFDETITFGKLVGATLVIVGIVIYAYADKGDGSVKY